MQVKEIFPSSLPTENSPLFPPPKTQLKASGANWESLQVSYILVLGVQRAASSTPRLRPCRPPPPWRGWEPLTHLPSSSSPHEEGQFEGLHCRPSRASRQTKATLHRPRLPRHKEPGRHRAHPSVHPPQPENAGHHQQPVRLLHLLEDADPTAGRGRAGGAGARRYGPLQAQGRPGQARRPGQPGPLPGRGQSAAVQQL